MLRANTFACAFVCRRHRRLLLSLFGHVVGCCVVSASRWWWCHHFVVIVVSRRYRCRRVVVSAFSELPSRISTALGCGCSLVNVDAGGVLAICIRVRFSLRRLLYLRAYYWHPSAVPQDSGEVIAPWCSVRVICLLYVASPQMLPLSMSMSMSVSMSVSMQVGSLPSALRYVGVVVTVPMGPP